MVHYTCRDAALPATISLPAWLAACGTGQKAVRRHAFLAVCVRHATGYDCSWTSGRAAQPEASSSDTASRPETAGRGSTGWFSSPRALIPLAPNGLIDRPSATNRRCTRLAYISILHYSIHTPMCRWSAGPSSDRLVLHTSTRWPARPFVDPVSSYMAQPLCR